jgi:hypothetical protein
MGKNMNDYAALGGATINFFLYMIGFFIAIFIIRAVFSIGKIVHLLEKISKKLGEDEKKTDGVVIAKPLKPIQ